jgi:formamidopyrimidine-DNA glycosylase
MPELPEVETIACTLAPQIVGRAVTAVHPLHPRVLQSGAEFLPCFKDTRLVAARVFRRAKLLLIALEPDGPAAPWGGKELLMVFHLKMTGGFLVHPPATAPLRHTRLICDLSDEGRLFFDDARTFGYCRIMRPEDMDAWTFWAGLGPEPLGMESPELAAHCARAFAKRTLSIKAALLNQTLLAGIGNIYTDEALFQAGIHPLTPASSLDGQRLLALSESLQSILRRAIRECGSSIRNYSDARGNAGAFQNNFAVYGRKGKPCLSCERPLVGVRIAGRATVFCPRCQK